MLTSRTDLADLGTFLAIARHLSFRRAGLELGVSASALSHALKAMEARLGVRLINRTSRSVTLTATGEELLASLDAPFAAIGSALDGLNRHYSRGYKKACYNLQRDKQTFKLSHMCVPCLFFPKTSMLDEAINFNN